MNRIVCFAIEVLSIWVMWSNALDEFNELDPSLLHVKSVNLTGMKIPSTIIATVPASIARENLLIPIAEENGILQIAMSDPTEHEVLLKLQFILAKNIEPVRAPVEQIFAAIERHYRQQ